MFVHIVLFWLKKDGAEEARQAMVADCHSMLAKIPTVRHIWAGRAAMTDREVADTTYDVGLCVVFDESAAHDLYQDDPIHKEFIAKHGASWERLRVYDFK